jgi:predicted HTH transcriptional regulator
LNYGRYFDLTQAPQPSNIESILHYFTEERIIVRQDNGLFAVTNMGALLFAKNLANFHRLYRKAVRIVQYQGNSRLQILREKIVQTGYAVDFDGLIKYIEALLPSLEVIENGLRKTILSYPDIAIRETVGNALIHQDFSITGTGPLVEVFDNRIEITNCGIPLVDVRRIIDNPPRSRNEKFAELMRRLRICEELGTGWDKIVISCELYQLPAPKIDLYEDDTKVSLFSEMPFSNISPEDKLWACYLHSCIKQVQNEQMTNSSLRERFGLKDTSSASISRLIKNAISKGIIKPLDPDTAPRYMKYIPYWA